MKYTKFTLKDYKAIAGELEIDIKKSLLPIIGINESGKTSILWGIFAFDEANDSLNDGRHMKNVGNLYKTSNRGEPSVIADIEATKDELIDILNDIDGKAETTAEAKAEVKKYKRTLSSWSSAVRIKRNLLSSQNRSEMTTFLKNIGSNHILRNREFVFTPKIEYKLVAERSEANQNSLTFLTWCSILELVRTHFAACGGEEIPPRKFGKAAEPHRSKPQKNPKKNIGSNHILILGEENFL